MMDLWRSKSHGARSFAYYLRTVLPYDTDPWKKDRDWPQGAPDFSKYSGHIEALGVRTNRFSKHYHEFTCPLDVDPDDPSDRRHLPNAA